MFRLRLIPDNTKIPFMKARYAGLITSAVLSLASVILFFHPGLNLGIDFQGGIIFEVRTPAPADFTALRSDLAKLNLGEVKVQRSGSANDVLIRLEVQKGAEAAQQTAIATVRAELTKDVPGVQILGTDEVGASVSAELYRNGMLAMGLAIIAMLAYISFRFEWQFGVGAVLTLILDVTKTIGFFALFQLQFNLDSIAAILTIMGFSINDKVVVYDRVRENLRLFRNKPLRELIDLSINETLNRTINTSLSVFLAAMPLALFGGEALREFSIVILFGIVLGTSSSIGIAAPILLFLGENRLHRVIGGGAPAPTPSKS